MERLGSGFGDTITGHVSDSSGGVIPQCTVQVTNTATNEVAVAKTDRQGTYTLPLLTPGTYRLTAEASGFKKYIRGNIVLNVGDVSGVDISMEVGQTSESITVTAETPALETENADHGLVVDQKRVTELPLNARNPFMLSILSAGVNFNGNQIYQRPFDNGAIADWSVNGGLDRKNEFLLDGARTMPKPEGTTSPMFHRSTRSRNSKFRLTRTMLNTGNPPAAL